MDLSLTAAILWAVGFMLNAALLSVLLYKRRFRNVPWFVAWIGFGCLYTICLFLAYRYGPKHLYAYVYWRGAFIDVLLQVAVVLEIAATVLRRTGRWVPGARIRLAVMGSTAPLVALGMAWFMNPAAETTRDAWFARANLFATILVFLLFVAVVIASYQLGLWWRTYAVRESYGLVLWVVTGFMADTLHAYWRTLGHFSLLEYVRIGAFQLASLYWMVAFWLPEPAVSMVPKEYIPALQDLKQRLDYTGRNHV